jgi:hypothetical protein
MSEREFRRLVLIKGVLYIPEREFRRLPSQVVTSHYLYIQGIESVVRAHNKCGARV